MIVGMASKKGRRSRKSGKSRRKSRKSGRSKKSRSRKSGKKSRKSRKSRKSSRSYGSYEVSSYRDERPQGDSCNTCLKAIQILCSLAHFAYGGFMVGIVVWFLFKHHEKFNIIGDVQTTLIFCTLGLGCSYLVLSILGIISAIKVKRVFLIFIILILLIIIIGEGVGAYFMYKVLPEKIEKGMKETFTNMKKDNNTEISWERAQHNVFECCGVDGYRDYFNPRYKKNKVSQACCKNINVICANFVNTMTDSTSISNVKKKIFTKGCYKTFLDFVIYHILEIVAGSILAAVQLIMLIMLIALCCRANKKRYERRRRNYPSTQQSTQRSTTTAGTTEPTTTTTTFNTMANESSYYHE